MTKLEVSRDRKVIIILKELTETEKSKVGKGKIILRIKPNILVLQISRVMSIL